MNSNSQEHSSPRLFHKMKLNATQNLLCKYKKWLHTCWNKMHNINYCSVRTFLFIGNSAPPTNQTLVNLVVVRIKIFRYFLKILCSCQTECNATQKSHYKGIYNIYLYIRRILKGAASVAQKKPTYHVK